MPDETLEQIFSSIDKKLSLNLASEITDEEIERVYAYYSKEKFRFNQDQSQFVKPGRKSSKSVDALIENIKKQPPKLLTMPKTQSQTQSPLYEADPHSIDELFLRLVNNQIKNMPREILNSNLSEKVKSFRNERIKFIQLELEHAKNRAQAKERKTSLSKNQIIENIRNNPLEF